MKRILAGFMAMVLTAMSLAFIQPVYADTLVVRNVLPDSESDLQDGIAGCGVFSIEMTDGIAKVGFETTQDAILVVAAYNETGTEMLASGSIEVSPNETTAAVLLKRADGGDLPTYFYLCGMLADPVNLRPLCSSYESPAYTRGFKQFPQAAYCDGIYSHLLTSQDISASVDLEIIPAVRFCKSGTYQYAEIMLDYSVKAENMVITKAGEKMFVLPEMNITVGNSDYALTPEFTVKSDSAAELDGTLSGTVGFYVLNNSGIHSLTSTPSLKTTLDTEGDISLGLSFDIQNITIQDDYGRDIRLGMKASVSGEAKGELVQPENSESVQHSCSSCLDGDIYAETELGFRAELPDTQSSGTQDFDYQKSCGAYQAGDFYVSSENGRSDSISCPKCKYKTTITVMDADRNILEDAGVQFTAVSGHNGTADESASVVTDKNGRASAYLAGGSYDLTVTAAGYGRKAQRITVQDYAKSIAVAIGSFYGGGIFGDIKTVTTSSSLSFKEIHLGRSFSGGITEDGSLYMWGMNMSGELGLGIIGAADISVPTKVKDLDNVAAISLGTGTSAAVTTDGHLYMWGANDKGQLGIGDLSLTKSPLPLPVEKLPDNVVAVSLGEAHCGALTADGELYMWGDNEKGQLGTGDTVLYSEPKKVLDNVISVSLGGNQSAAITSTSGGALYMWGSNDKGQLGNGDISHKDVLVPVPILDHITSVSLGYYHSAAITTDGHLYMWGANDKGQLGNGSASSESSPVEVLSSVKSISLGYMYSSAITDDGELLTWGFNDMGQLGNKDTYGIDSSQNKPVKILDDVKSISLGYAHSGAFKNDGSFYMWGDNSCGQLGIEYNNGSGSDVWIYPEPEEMSKHAVQIKTVTKKVSFAGLNPNRIYNCYITKRKTDAPLSSSDLQYIAQGTADSDGSLSFENLPEELADANMDVFLAGDMDDLSAAVISVPDLEYNGKVQYVRPVVTYNGRRLTYGKDYELLKDYSAKDPGSYTVTVHGIGNYTGFRDASYQITGSQEKRVESIILSLTDASVKVGNTLQLIAKVLPEDAADKSLVWSSGNPEIASVDQNGFVTAKRTGTVKITVISADGTVSASCVLTITAKSSGGSSGSGSGSGSSGSGSGSGSSGSGSGSGSSGSGSGDSSGNPGGSDSTGPDLEVKLLYYIVYFNANDGNGLSRKEMTLLYDDSLGIMPKVQLENHVFTGWYTQKAGGERVDSKAVLNASVTLYAHWDKVTKPSKVRALSLSSKKSGQCKVSFQGFTDVSGYEIVYSVNKNFKADSIRKTQTASSRKTLEGLKKGKTYYVKVRAYRKDSAGRKIYGAYSSVKKIKVKK